MTYKIDYRDIDIPEIDAFMQEYERLCQRFGFRLVIDDYSESGHYVTVGHLDDEAGFYFNLDYAAKDIPCIAKALDAVKAIRAAEDAAKAAKDQEILAAANDDPIAAIEALLPYTRCNSSSEATRARAAGMKAIERLKKSVTQSHGQREK